MVVCRRAGYRRHPPLPSFFPRLHLVSDRHSLLSPWSWQSLGPLGRLQTYGQPLPSTPLDAGGNLDSLSAIHEV